MKRLALVAGFVAGFMIGPPPVQGSFALRETTNAPIPRLFANLSRELAANTNHLALTYQLARLESMAYATNLTELPVEKETGLVRFPFPLEETGVPPSKPAFASGAARDAGLRHLTNAILLFERSVRLLRASGPAEDQQWEVAPIHLGLAWCVDQAGRKAEAVNAYRRALAIAWKVEVLWDFPVKSWLREIPDHPGAWRMPRGERVRGHRGPMPCLSSEIIRYLRPLLDPKSDAGEIAELKASEEMLMSMPRSYTPILVALEPGTPFEQLVAPDAAVPFDLDGCGLQRKWGWITPKAAWLVYAPPGSGPITSGLQMFGNVTFWIFWPNGYQALAALDDNGDGRLTGPELRGLCLWIDRNGNGISEPGEVVPVESLGITAIQCGYGTNATGMPWNPAGVVFQDGSTRATYDWTAPGR